MVGMSSEGGHNVEGDHNVVGDQNVVGNNIFIITAQQVGESGAQDKDARVIGGDNPDSLVPVKLADYVEDFSKDVFPVIRQRHFRNAILKGPMVIRLDHCRLVGVTFQHAVDDPETLWYEIIPKKWVYPIAVVEYCIFENCKTEYVGLAWTRNEWEAFTKEVMARQPDEKAKPS
jgi:hypothetical protein